MQTNAGDQHLVKLQQAARAAALDVDDPEIPGDAPAWFALESPDDTYVVSWDPSRQLVIAVQFSGVLVGTWDPAQEPVEAFVTRLATLA